MASIFSLLGCATFVAGLHYNFADLFVHPIQGKDYDLDIIVSLINNVRYKHTLLSDNNSSYAIGNYIDLFDYYSLEPTREFLRLVFHSRNLFNIQKNVTSVEEFNQTCFRLNSDTKNCDKFSGLEVTNLLNNLYSIGYFTPHYYISTSKVKLMEVQLKGILTSFMKQELAAQHPITNPEPSLAEFKLFYVPLIGGLPTIFDAVSSLCAVKGYYAELIRHNNTVGFNEAHVELDSNNKQMDIEGGLQNLVKEAFQEEI